MKKKSQTKKVLHHQTKKGKYSNRLSDSSVRSNHESFRVNDDFYRSLVESLVGYAIFTTDKDGNISSWNLGAQKLFGYDEKEIIGKNASIIFSKNDSSGELRKELNKVVKKGKVIIEQFYFHKNNSQFWASGLIFQLDDTRSVFRGFTFIIRDLTERKEIDKRKDDFISTATHELKSPITSMKLYAQIAEKEIRKSKNKKTIESVNELNIQLNKLMKLMDYLLDVAKIQKGKLQIKKTFFDLDLLINDVIKTIQVISKKHKIIVKGKTDEKIYADRDRIAQVLTNIITNAIKYSPESDRVIVEIAKNESGVVVSVKDFGFGISPSDQYSIFGRFYRATEAISNKIDGIGLGLYVAQQIVAAHNGKMWLESKLKKGSTFYFSLPEKKLLL